MSLVKNEPTPEGRALGEQLARLTDKAEAKLLAVTGEAPKRCVTCAFRRGTYPNGCAITTMDALKCVMELVPFYCHHSEKDERGNHSGLCAGWLICTDPDIGTAKPISTPWQFSHEL